MKKFKSKMFGMVNSKGHVNAYSLSYQRKICIDFFISEGTMTWEELKKCGWKCIEVDVEINPIIKP